MQNIIDNDENRAIVNSKDRMIKRLGICTTTKN